jgi:hypothetical protein
MDLAFHDCLYIYSPEVRGLFAQGKGTLIKKIVFKESQVRILHDQVIYYSFLNL